MHGIKEEVKVFIIYPYLHYTCIWAGRYIEGSSWPLFLYLHEYILR